MVRSGFLCFLIALVAVVVLHAGGFVNSKLRHRVKERKSHLYIDDDLDKFYSRLSPKEVMERTSRIYKDNKTDDVDKLYIKISQKEVGLMLRWLRYKKSSGTERAEALEEIRNILSERARVDYQVQMIGVLLFVSEHAHSILFMRRDHLLPWVDDQECYRSTLDIFNKHCGELTLYGAKHRLAFANICNNFVGRGIFGEACV